MFDAITCCTVATVALLVFLETVWNFRWDFREANGHRYADLACRLKAQLDQPLDLDICYYFTNLLCSGFLKTSIHIYDTTFSVGVT